MNNYTNHYHTNNDTRVNQKEVENIDKDHDLSREIRKLHEIERHPDRDRSTRSEIWGHWNRATDYWVEKNCHLAFCKDSEKGSQDLKTHLMPRNTGHLACNKMYVNKMYTRMKIITMMIPYISKTKTHLSNDRKWAIYCFYCLLTIISNNDKYNSSNNDNN